MTVICRFQGSIFCICKGADNVMLPLCDRPFDSKTAEHLTAYSKLGLRTLVFASKLLPQAEFDEWNKKRLAALLDKKDNKLSMATVAAEMEHSLSLSGITAIEDKLQ